jgi:outer membrane lipoprotein LolB
MIKKFVGMYPSYKVQPLVSDKGRLYFLLYPLVLCICSLLVGCASFVFKSPIVETSIIEKGGVTSSVNFELMGRVSAKGGDKGFAGGVRWSHTGTDDNIHLLSPFGQIVAQIKSNKDIVLLTTSEQKIYRAVDVENLTKQVLGWRLPLLCLQYWVRGVNSPKTKSEVDRDTDGRIIGIRQDGWAITYTGYFPSQLIQTERPRVLVLNRSNLKIKLVIDNWEAK